MLRQQTDIQVNARGLRVLCIAATLILMGCEQWPQQEKPVTSAPQQVDASEAEGHAASEEKKSLSEGNVAEQSPAVPLPKRRPDEVAARSTAEPVITDVPAGEAAEAVVDDLIGLAFEDVRKLLGQPAWEKDVYPARVWGYGGEHCSFMVFFYPKLDQQEEYRVLTFEAGQALGEGNEPPAKLPQTESAGEESTDAAEQSKVAQYCFESVIEQRQAKDTENEPQSRLPSAMGRNGVTEELADQENAS